MGGTPPGILFHGAGLDVLSDLATRISRFWHQQLVSGGVGKADGDHHCLGFDGSGLFCLSNDDCGPPASLGDQVITGENQQFALRFLPQKAGSDCE